MNIQKLKKVIQKANPEICIKFGDRTEIGTIYNGIKPSCRPIRLADVLMAIEPKQEKTYWIAIGNAGQFYEMVNNTAIMAKCSWNLADNNLDNQSKECKEFLIKLLIKKTS